MKYSMKELIESFPAFAIDGYNMGAYVSMVNAGQIKNIIYAGMGGSAISGDMMRELLTQSIRIPFEVIRHYALPAYADAETLVILSSFSGNTEETLSCAADALKRQCRLLCISRGGELLNMCSEGAYIQLSGDIPPRTALPKTFFALMKALQPFYENTEMIKELENAFIYMKTMEMPHERARKLAVKLKDRIPFIYSDSAYSSVVRRAANQLSENSKHIAHFNAIPEMNHNEIVGMHMPDYLKEQACALFIEMGDSMPRIKKRVEITAGLLNDEGFETERILIDKGNRIINVMEAVLLFDWVSYYLSIENKVDAVAIERIDALKERMSR